MSGKLFAVVVIVIALASAVPIINHTFMGANVSMPEDISTHGFEIDKQIDETMIEAGLSFLAAQLVLGFFVWKTAGKKDGPLKNFPGGAKYLVVAAVLLVGAEAIALGAIGSKAWAKVYFQPASADALQIQAQAGQFAFYFRYAGPDGKFGGIHPEKIDEGNSNFFGLDPENDIPARDDIVSASLVVPVDRPILLTMHSKDVGHSLFIPQMRLQQDFVPGLIIPVHFTATGLTKTEIVCTQLCGLGHYNMRAYLQVLSKEDYAKWLTDQAGQ